MRLDLARLGALAPDEAITDGYVRALFDDYAPKFDRHLTKSLAYRGPELIADALRRACSKRLREYRFGLALDLGCGTGLMAQALEGVVRLHRRRRSLAAHAGEGARRRSSTMPCTRASSSRFSPGAPTAEADLVVAADVFVYMAALDAAFREAHRVLRREGLLRLHRPGA